MSDGEPAIPIRALVPVQAINDLVDFAAVELGSLRRTGIRLTFDLTEQRDTRVMAVLTVTDVAKGTMDVGAYVTRRYVGQWVAGAYLQWMQQD